MSECLGSSQNSGINAPLKANITNIFISLEQMNGWKMTFLLEKSVFTGHSFIFRGFSASTFAAKSASAFPLRLSLSPGTLGRTKTRGSGVLPNQPRRGDGGWVGFQWLMKLERAWVFPPKGQCFSFQTKMGWRHRTEVFGR